MKIWKGILFVVISIIAAVVLAWPFYLVYNHFFYSPVNGFFTIFDVMARYTIGIILAYLFFLPFIFTAFGGTKKYWWIGIAGMPVLAFLMFFDFRHLYFHLIFPLAGWLLGLAIGRLISFLQKRTV